MLMQAMVPTSHAHSTVAVGQEPHAQPYDAVGAELHEHAGWSIDTAVGAEAWPSGDHVCNGQMPARIPKPT